MRKRICSILLVFTLIISLMPMTAFADDDDMDMSGCSCGDPTCTCDGCDMGTCECGCTTCSMEEPGPEDDMYYADWSFYKENGDELCTNGIETYSAYVGNTITINVVGHIQSSLYGDVKSLPSEFIPEVDYDSSLLNLTSGADGNIYYSEEDQAFLATYSFEVIESSNGFTSITFQYTTDQNVSHGSINRDMSSFEYELVNSYVYVNGIELSQTDANIEVGETISLSATVWPEDATNQIVTWTSDDEYIASVDNEGTVTGISDGNCNIWATIEDGDGSYSASCYVTVETYVPVETIELNRSSIIGKPGTAASLLANVYPEEATNQTINWISSDSNIASVNSRGVVTFLSEGTCNVYAVTSDGTIQSEPCVVQCSDNLSLNRGDGTTEKVDEYIALNLGESYSVELADYNIDDLEFYSENDDYVSIVGDQKGNAVEFIITGNEVTGSEYDVLLYISENGNTIATFSVNVFEIYATGIELDNNTLSLMTGETHQLSFVLEPENVTYTDVYWYSEDESVAAVTENGLVRGISQGTTNIVVQKSGSDLTAVCEVTVEPADRFEITKQPEDITVAEGSKAIFSVEAIGNNVSFMWYRYNGRRWVQFESNQELILYDVSKSENGRQFKCYVQSDEGAEWTDVATLSVGDEITITKQLENVEAYFNEEAELSIAAESANYSYINYNWYSSTDKKTWELYQSGQDTLMVPAGNTDYFMCVLESGNSYLQSDIVSVTWKHHELSVGEIQGNSITNGEYAEFSVDINGYEYCINWELYDEESDSWNIMCNEGWYSGQRTAVYGIYGDDSLDGRLLRARVYTNDDVEQTTEPVTIHVVKVPLEITTQPVSQTIDWGTDAELNVIAEGRDVNYLWQRYDPEEGDWSNYSDQSKDGSLYVNYNDNYISNDEGYQFRCVISDDQGQSLISDEVTVIFIKETLVITTQPVSQTIDWGTDAELSVIAEGRDVNYLWQRYEPEDGNWSNYSDWSQDGSLYVDWHDNYISNDEGYQFRCIVSDSQEQSLISDEVTIIFEKTPITIKTQPVSVQNAVIGDSVSFYVLASGKDLNYAWYYSDNGIDWNFNGETSNVLNINIEPVNIVRKYKCIITDSQEQQFETDIVDAAIEISSSIIVEPGDQTTTVSGISFHKFIPEKSGKYLVYSYGENYDNTSNTCDTKGALYSSSWENLCSDDDGALEYNNFRYIYDFEAGETYYIEIGYLDHSSEGTINWRIEEYKPVAILSQDNEVTVTEGEQAELGMEVEGSGLLFKWYISRNGGLFWWPYDFSSGNKLNVDTMKKMDGYLFKCKVTDADLYSVESEPIKLNVKQSEINIISQPETNIEMSEEDGVELTVEAEGADLSYEWYRSTNDGFTWEHYCSGDILYVNTDALKGDKANFYCLIRDQFGNEVETDEIVVTKKQIPSIEITKQPEDVTATEYEKVTFAVEAEGSNLSYQWKYAYAGTTKWSNWGNEAEIQKKVYKKWDGLQVKCVITDDKGNSVETDVATLHILD